MFDYTETNMDENLEKEIHEKLSKNKEDDLEDILENYKGLNFVHVWSKHAELNKYEFHLATLSLEAGSIYFSEFCLDEEDLTHTIKINQVWELNQGIIKHPYENRNLNKKEIQNIYDSWKRISLIMINEEN